MEALPNPERNGPNP